MININLKNDSKQIESLKVGDVILDANNNLFAISAWGHEKQYYLIDLSKMIIISTSVTSPNDFIDKFENPTHVKKVNIEIREV